MGIAVKKLRNGRVGDNGQKFHNSKMSSFFSSFNKEKAVNLLINSYNGLGNRKRGTRGERPERGCV